jgi:putative glutamine amidotransferase
MTAPTLRLRPAGPARPVIGVLCCNELLDRPVQAVASRFIEPLSRIAGATVLLVPALADVMDTGAIAERLDGLLLTGSRSHVAPWHYGGDRSADAPGDEQRDLVALTLAGRMIDAGRPVFGICRGLHELNVLFGGTLVDVGDGGHHRGEADLPFADLFDNRHDVLLTPGGVLEQLSGTSRITVNSVHRQGVDRLGGGLTVEAVSAHDDLVEAFSARPCGGEVLAVQWHPEWGGAQDKAERAFFERIGIALGEHRTHDKVARV